MEEQGTLHATVEDLITHSKHQNLRVIGLPEGIEGNNLRQFMADLFKESSRMHYQTLALNETIPALDISFIKDFTL